MPGGAQGAHGPSDSRDLLIVPPILRSDAFDRFRGALPRSVRVHVAPLRIAEWSEPPVAYSLGWEVVGLKQLLDRLGLKRAHLMTAGWSSAAVLAFAMCYPERIGSLVLEDPGYLGARGVIPEDERATWELRRILGLTDGGMLQALGELVASPSERGHWAAYSGQRAPAEICLRIREFGRALLEYPTRFDRLAECSAPVLVAVGAATHEDSLLRGGALARAFPSGRVLTFPGCDRFRPAHDFAREALLAAAEPLWVPEPRRHPISIGGGEPPESGSPPPEAASPAAE